MKWRRMATHPSAPGPDRGARTVLRRLASSLAQMPGALLDAVLPPECLACEAAVEAQGTLCATCFRDLSFVTDPLCARCGVPFAHDGQAERGADGALLCVRCATQPPHFAVARAALRYDVAARRLILPFKHADRTENAKPLARQMARVGASLLARTDVIVTVPAHWRRLLARRYDQAALLGRALARIAGKPCIPDALRRLRATPALGEKSAAERAVTVEGAFGLRARARPHITGRTILLVDDVMTSGATADACARVLLDGGAATVLVLAAARVPDPRLRGG